MVLQINSAVASARAGATAIQPRIADAGADVSGDRSQSVPANGDSKSSPSAGASNGMKDVLDNEQRTMEEEQRHLLLDRQAFDLANEERSELMREEGVLRDMLMADLKNEDAYLKKWIELI
jgi:hypothetical protein